MHEVYGHSPAPVYKIDFGLLTLICYRQVLQHLVMPPSVSTLGQTGFESWQNVFNCCCVWTQRTRRLLTKTLLRVRGWWRHMRGCSDNESNPGCLHTPTNCFQLINGAEVRSRCVCVCVCVFVCEERARMAVDWAVWRVIFQTPLLLFRWILRGWCILASV